MTSPLTRIITAFPSLVKAVGGLTLLYSGSRILQLLYLYNRPSSLPRYLTEDAYALVTGGSDGIGFGFVEELLERGFNVIIHGRNETKLKGIRDRLVQQYPNRQIDIVVADASKADSVQNIADKCKGKTLRVLVNNVAGIITRPITVPLLENEPAIIDTHIDINTRFHVQLTRSLMPHLISSGKGVVLSIGSGGSSTGMPLASIYAGSKAFLLSWSASMKLEMEMTHQPIEFLFIQTGLVKSGAEPRRKPGFFIASSRGFAATALDRVGCGKRLVWAWWPHMVFEWFEILPESFFNWSIKMAIASKLKEEEELMRLEREGKATSG